MRLEATTGCDCRSDAHEGTVLRAADHVDPPIGIFQEDSVQLLDHGMTDRTTGPLRFTSHWILWIALLAASAWWVLEAMVHGWLFDGGTLVQQLIPTDNNELWMRSLVCLLLIAFGAYASIAIDRIDRAREEQSQHQKRLENALGKVLSGFLPICAGCKRIRLPDSDPDMQASWQQIESYITQRTDVEFTHSVCPACEQEFYQENLAFPAREYEI